MDNLRVVLGQQVYWYADRAMSQAHAATVIEVFGNQITLLVFTVNGQLIKHRVNYKAAPELNVNPRLAQYGVWDYKAPDILPLPAQVKVQEEAPKEGAPDNNPQGGKKSEKKTPELTNA